LIDNESTTSPPPESGLEKEVMVPFVSAIEPFVPKSNLTKGSVVPALYKS